MCMQRDLRGVSGFFKSEYRRLVSFARSMLREAGSIDAEDLVQDVMLALSRRLDVADQIEDLAAYVYGALRNRIIDIYRRRRETLSADLLDPLSDGRPQPAEISELSDLLQEIERAIDGLAPNLHVAFRLVELEGYTHREAAQILGVPLGTVLSWNREARRRLSRELDAFRTLL